MRKMKKMLTLIMSVAMLVSMNITAFAAESGPQTDDFALDGVVVTVTDEKDEGQSDIVGGLDCVGENAMLVQSYAATETKDLGTDGSIGLSWSVNSEGNIRSQYNYKTNSEQLKVTMKGDLDTSVTLKLYNTSGTEVASKTATVDDFWNTTFTFSNLSASTTYYFQLYNNDQHDASFTGTISAK